MKTMKKSMKIEIAITVVIIAVVAFFIFFFQIRSNRSGTTDQVSYEYIADQAVFVEYPQGETGTEALLDE